MTVYVDDMQARVGRMIMCHMIADTDEELHAMAAAIGVARRWHQAPPQHDSHYDIAKAARAKAVTLGAVEVRYRVLGAMAMVRRVTGTLPRPDEAEAALLQIIRDRSNAAVDALVKAEKGDA